MGLRSAPMATPNQTSNFYRVYDLADACQCSRRQAWFFVFVRPDAREPSVPMASAWRVPAASALARFTISPGWSDSCADAFSWGFAVSRGFAVSSFFVFVRPVAREPSVAMAAAWRVPAASALARLTISPGWLDSCADAFSRASSRLGGLGKLSVRERLSQPARSLDQSLCSGRRTRPARTWLR